MKNTIPSFTTDKFVEEKPKDFVPAYYDADGVQATSSIGGDGLEYPDPVPMAPDVRVSRPVSDLGMRAMIERIASDEAVRRMLEAQEYETEDEADDFDIEDDPLDPLTEYERHFMPPPPEKKAPPKGGAAEVSQGQGAPPAQGPAAQAESRKADSSQAPPVDSKAQS